MFKKLKISQKLIIFMILIGVIPLLLGILFANYRVSHELENQALEKLKAVQNIKLQQVEDYIHVLKAQLHIVKDDPYIRQALMEFDRAFEAEGDKVLTPAWNALAEKYDQRLKDIVEDNEWGDMLLLHTEGDIVYTVKRKSDLGMIIPDSDLRKSSLGEAFEKAKVSGSQDFSISDFNPYAPAAGEPAAFMMAHMRDANGELKGYVALEISIDKINQLMLQRDGMGDTGETYLVGPDNSLPDPGTPVKRGFK